jgi:hypothetical protein
LDFTTNLDFTTKLNLTTKLKFTAKTQSYDDTRSRSVRPRFPGDPGATRVFVAGFPFCLIIAISTVRRLNELPPE